MQEYINNLAILINSPPEVILLTIDLNGPALRARGNGKDLIDEESIAIASVLSFQPAGINGTELDAPETDRFSGYGDASLSQEVFDISMTVTTRLRLKRK